MFIPDYLAIGHLSLDHTPAGTRLGGSVAYAALTARALGLRPAVVTACHDESIAQEAFQSVPVVCVPSSQTTTFALEERAHGRNLRLQARAALLTDASVPPAWTRAPIVHLAPIAREVDWALLDRFEGRFVGVTPQGWLRQWDDAGRITPASWPEAAEVLARATAVVLSIEDLGGEESRIPPLAAQAAVLVVTRGAEGATVYWHGETRDVPAPRVPVADTTGAGDIFAAAFFVRLFHTRDPWEAARFAVALASASVTRQGLASVPTADEIRRALARQG